MHTHFDDELNELYLGLVDMANCTEKSVSLLCDAFHGRESDIRNQIESYAEEIKGKYHRLEAICMHLLLRRQPVAKDLRRISSVMKIISDLERIGDNSADITEVLSYCVYDNFFHLVQLDEMCYSVAGMLNAAVSAFISNDITKAQSVVLDDDVIDEHFRRVKASLSESIRQGDPESDSAPDLMMIAKYLERMGDHAASIANWVLVENGVVSGSEQ